MNRTDFLEAYKVKDATSEKMRSAIAEWYDLYYGDNLPYGEQDNQRLAPTITKKIKKAMFGEYATESDNEWARGILEEANIKKLEAVEQALIGGRSWLKPIIRDDGPAFTVVSRDNVLILGTDERGHVTDIGLEEKSSQGGKYYTLYERRTVEEGKLYIDTRLYESDSKAERGRRVPLSRLARYEGVEDMLELNIDNIGMAEMICPAENCVDGSNEPVSVYAAAVNLMHRINENEYQLSGEFERGESRIFVSSDLMKADGHGRMQLTDNVFVGIDDNPEEVGIQTFAPALRDASFLTRKEAYLRDIESVIGLKRGLLSNVDAEAKTATEITSSAGEYNLSIIEFQEAWEKTLREAVKIAAQIYAIYGLPSADVPDEDIIVSWGNGILYDKDKTLAEYMSLYQMGLIKGEIVVAYYFDIPIKTEADLAKVRAEYMPQLQGLLGAENA